MKTFYLIYYAPAAQELYFCKRPTNKDLEKLAAKYKWVDDWEKKVFITKEKFEKL